MNDSQKFGLLLNYQSSDIFHQTSLLNLHGQTFKFTIATYTINGKVDDRVYS